MPKLSALKKPHRRIADERTFTLPDTGGRTLIDTNETARRVGCHPLTLYRWKRTIPEFPRPIRISPNRVAYFEDEINEYINTRPRA
jgi:predicted DNA-binding transcriptional regulator AlpA